MTMRIRTLPYSAGTRSGESADFRSRKWGSAHKARPYKMARRRNQRRDVAASLEPHAGRCCHSGSRETAQALWRRAPAGGSDQSGRAVPALDRSQQRRDAAATLEPPAGRRATVGSVHRQVDGGRADQSLAAVDHDTQVVRAGSRGEERDRVAIAGVVARPFPAYGILA